MDSHYQKLVSALSGQQNLLLASLLSGIDVTSWEENKHIIISHEPLLTLEMAINRVCQRKQHSIPTPRQILAALEYAKAKQDQANAARSIKIAS